MTEPLRPAGYIHNTTDGPVGSQGIAYDYITAANGLFIQANSPHLTGRVMMARATVRGLNPVDQKISLPHGPIPRHLLQEGVRWMLKTPDTERFFAIRWNQDSYRLHIPIQHGHQSRMTYTPPDDAVAEFHSHTTHEAFFSGTDNLDEQAFRIYGVIGRLDLPQPKMVLRLGIYGHYMALRPEQIFDDICTNPRPS